MGILSDNVFYLRLLRKAKTFVSFLALLLPTIYNNTLGRILSLAEHFLKIGQEFSSILPSHFETTPPCISFRLFQHSYWKAVCCINVKTIFQFRHSIVVYSLSFFQRLYVQSCELARSEKLHQLAFRQGFSTSQNLELFARASDHDAHSQLVFW